MVIGKKRGNAEFSWTIQPYTMRYLTCLLSSIIICSTAFSQSSITLRKSFVDSFQYRATIDCEYDVWYTHHAAKPAAEDGDIHFSGYDKRIGMPTVAEILNAKDQDEAIGLIIEHEGKGNADNPLLTMTGVWRLWPEHMGSGASFVQGMKLSKTKIQSKKTNPDHVFEIHPMTSIGDIDLLSSFHNIPGYTPKDWRDVNDQLRAKSFVIKSTANNITFTTKQVGFNYIDLWIRIDSLPEIGDGAYAYCRTFDSDFDPEQDNIEAKTVTDKTRIVLVKGTGAYDEAMEKGVGGFMHILGTPRLNLSIIAWRVEVSAERPEVLKWRLPFEIIADGVIE